MKIENPEDEKKRGGGRQGAGRLGVCLFCASPLTPGRRSGAVSRLEEKESRLRAGKSRRAPLVFHEQQQEQTAAGDQQAQQLSGMISSGEQERRRQRK